MVQLVRLAIEDQIFLIREHRVMVDYDLAKLYEVPTKALIQAVKRNPLRFPADFVFQLTPSEKIGLVTNCDRFAPLKHSSKPPYVFTELGVSMLSSVLNSDHAALVNVAIMRAFVKFRIWFENHKELARKIQELEKRYDSQFKSVFDAIQRLLKPARVSSVPIVKGFGKE